MAQGHTASEGQSLVPTPGLSDARVRAFLLIPAATHVAFLDVEIKPYSVIPFLFNLPFIDTILFFEFLCIVLAPYTLNVYKQFQT